MKYLEYTGMSYQQASIAAAKLLAAANATGQWTRDLPERLIVLRGRMHPKPACSCSCRCREVT